MDQEHVSDQEKTVTSEVHKTLDAVMSEFITPSGDFDVSGEGISAEDGLAKAMRIDRVIREAEMRLGLQLRLAVLREIEKHNPSPNEALDDSFWARVMSATRNPLSVQTARKHPTQRLTRLVPPPVRQSFTTWQDSYAGFDKPIKPER